MTTEDKLMQMSKSIAYWYTQPEPKRKHTNQVIFPIELRQKHENYQLLRLKHDDSNIIIGPSKQIYEITQDISVELEQKHCMVFLENITKNKQKIQIVEKIQPYSLKDEKKLKIIKSAKQMFQNKIPCAIILVNGQHDYHYDRFNKLVQFVQNNIRQISYLNINKNKIVRQADIIDTVKNNQFIILLGNINQNELKLKQKKLINQLSKKYPEIPIKIKAFHSENFKSYRQINDFITIRLK